MSVVKEKDRVYHIVFGQGQIIKNDSRYVTVNFKGILKKFKHTDINSLFFASEDELFRIMNNDLKITYYMLRILYYKSPVKGVLVDAFLLILDSIINLKYKKYYKLISQILEYMIDNKCIVISSKYGKELTKNLYKKVANLNAFEVCFDLSIYCNDYNLFIETIEAYVKKNSDFNKRIKTYIYSSSVALRKFPTNNAGLEIKLEIIKYLIMYFEVGELKKNDNIDKEINKFIGHMIENVDKNNLNLFKEVYLKLFFEEKDSINKIKIIEESSSDNKEIGNKLKEKIQEIDERYEKIEGIQESFEKISNYQNEKCVYNKVQVNKKVIDNNVKSQINLNAKVSSDINTTKIIENSDERQLFLTELFKKDYKKLKDKELKERIINTLDELSYLVNSNSPELGMFFRKRNGKKFKGIEYLSKFYMTDAHRIIYALGKDIGKMKYANSIFLLRYVADHDRQGIVAKNTINYDGDEIYVNNEINSKHLNQEKVLDKSIVYYAIKGKIDNLLNDKDDFNEVLLNSEQDNCVIGCGPLIVKGNAGSGKTLVSLKIMKMLNKQRRKGIYLTYSEQLKNLVEKEFNAWGNDCKNQFFSITRYYLMLLNIDIKNYVDFYVFKRWYSNRSYAYDFDPSDVWREICSVLKGYMFREWNRDLRVGALISYEQYMELTEVYSQFKDKEKLKVFGIAREYVKWLMDKDLYDDNDLARQIILKVSEGLIEKIETMIVDEVQDLTDVQLESILNLVKNFNIYFCGDQNQIINPTLFDFKRMKHNIYLKDGNSKNLSSLKNNYRSVPPIVDYINNLNKVRQEYIGKQKADDDMDEIAIRAEVENKRIMLLGNDEKNLRYIVSMFEETPSAAVIVPNTHIKEKIESLLNQRYSCIFTINEIKGLEFNHVVCYNLIDENKESWAEIFKYEGRRSTRHRFYFNLFYVAITRAREYLFFMEGKELDIKIKDKLMNFNFIEDVNEDILNLNFDILPEEWLIQGKKYELVADFDRAIRAYKKYELVSEKSIEKEIKRCEAFIYKRQGDYGLAAEYFLEIEDFKEASECYSQISNYEKVIECELKGEKSEMNIDIIELCLNKVTLNQKIIVLLEEYYFKPMIEGYKEQCEVIAELAIDELKEISYEQFRTS